MEKKRASPDLNRAIVDYVRNRGHELPAALKMREAREYLGGLSVPTVHRLVRRGLLRPNKSTRHLIFLRSDLDRFLRDGQA
jgi:hypothetical protein